MTDILRIQRTILPPVPLMQAAGAPAQDRTAVDTSCELYLTRIAAAETLHQLNKISEAAGYLGACPPQMRGAEWHFPNRFLGKSDTTIRVPGTETFSSLPTSPDGGLFQFITIDRRTPWTQQ